MTHRPAEGHEEDPQAPRRPGSGLAGQEGLSEIGGESTPQELVDMATRLAGGSPAPAEAPAAPWQVTLALSQDWPSKRDATFPPELELWVQGLELFVYELVDSKPVRDLVATGPLVPCVTLLMSAATDGDILGRVSADVRQAILAWAAHPSGSPPAPLAHLEYQLSFTWEERREIFPRGGTKMPGAREEAPPDPQHPPAEEAADAHAGEQPGLALDHVTGPPVVEHVSPGIVSLLVTDRRLADMLLDNQAFLDDLPQRRRPENIEEACWRFHELVDRVAGRRPEPQGERLNRRTKSVQRCYTEEQKAEHVEIGRQVERLAREGDLRVRCPRPKAQPDQIIERSGRGGKLQQCDASSAVGRLRFRRDDAPRGGTYCVRHIQERTSHSLFEIIPEHGFDGLLCDASGTDLPSPGGRP